jgi:phosphoglycolate phosphatase-like HAD superfamily hydrolase
LNVQRERAVLIGDSLVDQEAARRAGVPFIWHTKGYDDGVDQNAVEFRFDRYPELMDRIGLSATARPTQA